MLIQKELKRGDLRKEAIQYFTVKEPQVRKILPFAKNS